MVAPRARNEHGTIEYIVDAEADLTSIVNPQVSAFALAMSEKTIWTFTGSIWEQIGGGGSAGPHDHATVMVASSTAPQAVKDVSNYVCDGTADNVEIQAALGTGAKRVLLSEGTFNIAASIEMFDNQTLEGTGIGTILFLVAGTNLPVIRENSGAAGQVFFVKILNLKIDGNDANNTSGHGIHMRKAHTWEVQGLHIDNAADNGIKVEGTSSALTALNNWIKDTRVEDSQNQGIFVSSFAPNNHIKGCIVGGTSNFDCIEIANDETVIEDCHVHTGARYGFYLNGAANTILHNSFAESCNQSGIKVESTSDGSRIVGCIAFNNGLTAAGDGFNIAGTDTSVVGCHAFDRQGTKTQDYGIQITAAATGTLLTGNVAKAGDNQTGGVLDGGTGSRIFLNAEGDQWAAVGDIADVADAEAAGTSTTVARGDHVHSAAAYVKEADANWVDLTDGGATALHSHAGGAAHTIKDAGVSETQRTNLDFQDGFIVSDNAGADATEVDLDFGSGATQAAAGDHTHAGAGHTIADAGVAETQRATLDFQDGFEVTDNAGANSTDVDLSYGAAGYPLDVAAAEADGTAITVARADHVHAHGSGYLADAHHARSHDHSAAGDGTTLTPATLNVPNAAAPAPTAEGQMAWDNDGNFLVVGDGLATKEFFPTVDATSDPLAVSTAAADGTEATVARKDHVHAHEAAHINHDTTWAAKGDLIVASANDTASVVTVGANDTILMADSAAGNGVKWAAAATTTEIADIAEAEAAGTSDTYARGDHVHSGNIYRLESESGVFTIGGFFKDLASPDAYIIWRAPFACTVTAIRGYVDAGTTTVINAFKGSVASPTNFSTADMTVTSATTWISDTTLDTTSVASGDAVGVEVVTVGTATEIAVQIDFTRP